MKYLLLILVAPCLLIFPATAGAVTGDASRFDFTAGIPDVVADNTLSCNNSQTVRYDFIAGVPSVVFDTTSVGCVETITGTSPIVNIKSTQIIIRGGPVRIY